MADWVAATAAAERVAAAWASEPGGAIALFDRRGLRAASCGGLASLEHGLPFTPDTPTRYASISKHVLAAMLLKTGMDLAAALATSLPDLPEALGAVPLLRALDMTGGLPDMMETMWQTGVPFTATVSAEEIALALRRQDRLCSPPGTEMAYSNTGWRLGQAVLEARIGLSYAAALQRDLFGPLGLPIAFPYDEAEPVTDLATGYWRDAGTWRRGRYGLHVSASGGLTGSAAALAGWASALMAGRAPLEGVLDRLLAPRHFVDGTASAYRLGLVETTLGATRIAAHSGSLPGYRNHMLMAPDRGVGVVVLMNRDADPLLPALHIMAALLGEAAPKPAPDLPAGLYAEAAGPAWAEMAGDAMAFMGAGETMIAAPDGHHRSIPSTLEIDVHVTAEAVQGRIGGVQRNLLRVPDGLALDPTLAGLWQEPASGAALLIRPDGSARWPGMGGIGQEVELTPLPGQRALATLKHAMWQHRPCLVLQPDGTLLVASHRARVLRFVRV